MASAVAAATAAATTTTAAAAAVSLPVNTANAVFTVIVIDVEVDIAAIISSVIVVVAVIAAASAAAATATTVATTISEICILNVGNRMCAARLIDCLTVIDIVILEYMIIASLAQTT